LIDDEEPANLKNLIKII